jgi:hypothetical protein
MQIHHALIRRAIEGTSITGLLDMYGWGHNEELSAMR